MQRGDSDCGPDGHTTRVRNGKVGRNPVAQCGRQDQLQQPNVDRRSQVAARRTVEINVGESDVDGRLRGRVRPRTQPHVKGVNELTRKVGQTWTNSYIVHASRLPAAHVLRDSAPVLVRAVKQVRIFSHPEDDLPDPLLGHHLQLNVQSGTKRVADRQVQYQLVLICGGTK